MSGKRTRYDVMIHLLLIVCGSGLALGLCFLLGVHLSMSFTLIFRPLCLLVQFSPSPPRALQ